MMRILTLAALVLVAACSDPPVSMPPPARPAEIEGTLASLELDADLAAEGSFFALPYPSDLRLAAAAQGSAAQPGPDLRGFPNPKDNEYVRRAKAIAGERPGFPVVPVGYFRFSAPLAVRDATRVLPADPGSPILLLDVDPSSPERGRLFPLVADTPMPDDYVPRNLLTVAARPGIVLAAGRTYAFVVLRALGDAAGARLGVPLALEELKAGLAPGAARGAAALRLYTPLWSALEKAGVPIAEVAAATVFTTGDVVAELGALGDRAIAAHPVTVTGLAVDPDDGAAHERYCELHARVRYPQFQRGTVPFDDPDEGTFLPGPDGLPVTQGEVDSPVTITLPRAPMPERGFPLALYFHGSDGLSTQVVDRGPVRVAGEPKAKGEGPAHTLAPFGIAMASSGLPASPERLDPMRQSPCVTVSGYLNFCNLNAMRDTFRQGVLEQRMLIAALRTLEIAPEAVAACPGLSLPAGQHAYRFDPDALVATGQSMGGMYTNMIGATEPRIRAVVPTGAGGFWTYFILHTQLVPGASRFLSVVIGASDEWTFMHPALHLVETMWESIEPMVYMPRLARRPLAGHPVRPIYEPVGKDDEYFPPLLYDAIALAYGHPQAGDVVWPSMQEALATAGLSGLRSYPVTGNLASEGGAAFTGVVVQYAGDGLADPHDVAFQLDAVKHQMGCFFSTFLATGVATVPAPAPLGSPCPR